MSGAPGLRLSIVIPTKDRPRLLDAAVKSALDALPPDAEVLVVDDRSTQPVAESLLPGDPRLRVTVSAATPGASGARNWGVQQASGTRILFLDDDDLLRPGYPDWILEQTADYGFSAISRFSGQEPPAIVQFVPGTTAEVDGLRPFRRQVTGLGCGFWLERGVFLDTGGIAEDIRVNEDTEFSIRLLRAGLRGLSSAEPGVHVRQHRGESGETGHLTHAAGAAERAGYFGAILARHSDWLDGHPEAQRHLRMRQLKLLARANDPAAARAALGLVRSTPEQSGLWLYYHLNRFAYRLRLR